MTQQDIEQYRTFTEKLKTEELRNAALTDIKNLLTYKSAPEAAPILRNIGISKILHCLHGTDKEQLKLACEVLKLCFEKFDTGDVVKTYTSHIMYLLRHNKDCVRRLAIDEICKVVTTDPTLLPVPQYIDVYVAVGQMVTDEDIGVANKAVLITSNLSAEAYPRVLDEMKIALEGNTSSKCNAYEVIIKISTRSHSIFEICVAQGYYDFMVNELQTDDVLYQLNILELLSLLAIKPHGIAFLIKQGTLQKISELVRDLKNNPLGGLLTPGSKYIQIIDKLGDKDPTPNNDPVDQRITLMTREWFRSLSKEPGPMETMFEICKNPFQDIQLAGLTLLDAVCQHQWGEEMVARVAGFMEYLLDRSVVLTKQSKEAKYDIIKRLSQSSAFDNNIIMRLKTYVEQGPFYSESTLQVAMEEE
ncbi:jg4726 [Pararge aegeria aegeria]|uniref:26S proteasome non-ATPase regulatory subunit 5 n=1 Tax=Pararge aegeria aegeria TaxID=348720 RepID=A0A8S4SN95_9NEOP|nr:jg4726 [Pararge aegeria aegeria]